MRKYLYTMPEDSDGMLQCVGNGPWAINSRRLSPELIRVTLTDRSRTRMPSSVFEPLREAQTEQFESHSDGTSITPHFQVEYHPDYGPISVELAWVDKPDISFEFALVAIMMRMSDANQQGHTDLHTKGGAEGQE